MFSTPKSLDGSHFDTQSVHAGEPAQKPYGSLTVPVVQT